MSGVSPNRRPGVCGHMAAPTVRPSSYLRILEVKITFLRCGRQEGLRLERLLEPWFSSECEAQPRSSFQPVIGRPDGKALKGYHFDADRNNYPMIRIANGPLQKSKREIVSYITSSFPSQKSSVSQEKKGSRRRNA
jgi:hypothetical protein